MFFSTFPTEKEKVYFLKSEIIAQRQLFLYTRKIIIRNSGDDESSHC